MGAWKDGLGFIERGAELSDGLIVGGMSEVVKPDGQGVGFRVGKQIDVVVEDVTQEGTRIVGPDEVLSKQ